MVATNEQGHAGTSIVPWSGLTGDDHVPELTWPNSVETYHLMRTDAQIRALLRGVTHPIRGFRWAIDPNGSRPEIVRHFADDLGLPVVGEEPAPKARRRGRFSWDDHVRHALLHLVYGHMPFEQVYRIGDDGLAHIRKWAPRMPRSISEWKVARDGGLEAIIQHGTGLPGEPMGGVRIDIDRLIVYVHEQEGGNWLGESMLRPCYRHWLRKDRLLRVDAMKHERNGMGVPNIEAPPGATPRQMAELDKMAQRYKAGEAAGGATPAGARLRLVGVEGSLPDTIASIRYDDEQMARAFLEMFVELGSTATGHRALGETFLDFFVMSLDATAGHIADVTNQHGIEDLVDINWGEDEQAPLIVYENVEDESLAVEEIVRLVESGTLAVDDEVEEWIRERYRMPERTGPRPATPLPGTPPGLAAGKGRGRRVAAAAELNLPDRPLRRQPYSHEVAAAVDFAEIDRAWDVQVDKIVSQWSEIQAMQIDDLVAQVEDAAERGDLYGMATVRTQADGVEIIQERMDAMVLDGAIGAVLEARRQGVEMPTPDIDAVSESLAPRALATATLLAHGISESASRHALLHAGGALDSIAIAGAVREHLESLSDAFLRDQFGGAVTTAQNAGRLAVMEQADGRLYASELLDGATCSPCANKDGTEYTDEDAARTDYPSSGYRGCKGGTRCRGTLVKVYDESEPSVN